MVLQGSAGIISTARARPKLPNDSRTKQSHSTKQSLFLLLVNSLSRAKANKSRRAKPPELEKNTKPRITGETARTA